LNPGAGTPFARQEFPSDLPRLSLVEIHIALAAAVAAREGRIARAGGLTRERNPYQEPPIPDGRLRLREAWWRGWDRADAELAGSLRDMSATVQPVAHRRSPQ
jgi:hypothetical protein